MAVATYTKTGTKAKTAAKLPKTVFAEEIGSHQLLHQAFEAYRANGRQRLAQTLDRGEVRGGGRKPWRQKGTGRARHGSIRSPIWRTGGVTFGPSANRNYSRSISKQAKRQSVRQALSIAAEAGAIKVVSAVDFKDGKTKTAAGFFAKIDADRGVLLVVNDKTDNIVRATNNLGFVSVVQATYLNVYKILTSHNIVIEQSALETLEAWLTTKETK